MRPPRFVAPRVLAGVLCVLSFLARPAAAQQSTPEPQPDPMRIDEKVEVTGTRGAIDRENSPASSAVILRADLERRDVVTVDQALTTVEGVYGFRQRGLTDNEVGIGMRGFSGRAGGQSRILILLDGQPLNNAYTGAVNWTAIPLGEIDRVEVVRGPFSSLYGGNAMGGVVNVMTRPIERRSFDFSGQYGTHDTGLATLRAGGRFFGRLGIGASYEGLWSGGYPTQEVLRTATDSTAAGGTPVSGAVRYLTRTGTVNYAVGLRGNNTYERNSARVRGEYTLDQQTFVSAQYIRQANSFGWDDYTTWLRNGDGQLLDTGNVVFQDAGVWKRVTLTPSNYLGVVGGGSSNLYQAQLLRASEHAGEWRIQAGVNDIPRDRTGTPGAAATLAGGAGSYSLQQNRGAYGSAQWSKTAGRHQSAAGVDLRVDRATVSSYSTPDYIDGGNFSARETYAAGSARTWAVFAQDAVTVTDRLHVTVGGRYDAWRTYDGESQKGAGLPTAPFAVRSDGSATGKAALVFRASDATVLRASVGSAFRSPTVFDLYRDTRLSSGSLLLGNSALDPERMTSWEIGVRQKAGAFVNVDAAYYDNRIRNLIFRSVDLAFDPSGLTSRNLNAGRAHTRGVELAVTARPAAWLTLRPTYTFTDATIRQNDPAPATVGKQIPFVPRQVAAGTAIGTIKRVVLTGTARYQSAVFATDNNTDTVKEVPGAYDKFFEVDVAANYKLQRHVTINVSAENLFDTHYYLFYRNPGRVVMAGVRLSY
jgi:iron complex outermembrane receptor protein